MSDKPAETGAMDGPSETGFKKWAKDNVRMFFSLVFLSVITGISLFGLLTLDSPRNNAQRCELYCAPLLKAIEKQPGPQALIQQNLFDQCYTECLPATDRAAVADKYVNGPKIQLREPSEDLHFIARLSSNRSEVLRHLFALFQNLFLIGVLAGLFGIAIVIALLFFPASKITTFTGAFSGDTMKLFVSGAAVAATTAAAGYVTARATNPPDLSGLVEQATTLENKLLDLDKRIGSLIHNIEQSPILQMEDQFSKLDERLSTIDQSLGEEGALQKLQQQTVGSLDGINGKLDQQNITLARHEEILRNFQTQYAQIGIKLEQYSKGGPQGGGDLDALTARVAGLKTSIDTQNGRIQQVESILASLASGDRNLKEAIDTWKSEIGTSQSELRKIRRALEEN